MKKTFVTLLLSLAVFSGILLAAEDLPIDPKILSAFQKEFSFAQNVKWEDKGELKQVSFSLYDHGFIAWYNENAELVNTARNILYMQLPLSIIKTLQHDYADADLSGIIEVTNKEETYYQINAQVKNKKFILKATPYGTVTVIKRIK
jgi:hypothetical protein